MATALLRAATLNIVPNKWGRYYLANLSVLSLN